ncbi:MAG: TolC family protein [Calditrichaeota bacterium]|nr:TolC family protein [Calditrichota bacterium]
MKRLILLTVLIGLLINYGAYAKDEKNLKYLTFKEALSRALSYNNQLKAREFALKKAVWQKRNALSRLLPTVKLTTRYTWIDDSTFALRDFSRYFTDPRSPFKIPKTVYQESYYTSFDVSLTLFNASVLNGIFISGTNKSLESYLYKSARNNIIFQVVKSYLNVLRNIEVLNLQEDYLELARLNYEKAKRLYDTGRYSETEALRWQVEYIRQKSMVVANKTALRNNMALLSRLIKTDMRKEFTLENRLPQSLLDEAEKMMRLPDVEILKFLRLDDERLVEANAVLSANKMKAKISKLQYYNSLYSYLPTVALNYSYGWRENNTIDLDDYSPQMFVVNISIPLFSGFQNYTSARASLYESRQSREEFIDQLQNTRFLLTETVNRIINLKMQIALSKTNIEYSERNYRITERRKEKGIVSNIAFIDAKLSWQNARLADISNRYDFINAVVELYYLLDKLDAVIEQ